MVLDELRRFLGPGTEVIVVDDGSTDATAEVAREHGAIVTRHAANMGKGAAMRTGVGMATGDYLVFMDADATYPAEAVPRLVAMLETHDIVRGERSLDAETIPLVNRIGNKVFNRLIGSFHQIEGSDFMSGLYGMRRRVFDDLDIASSGFDIEVEIGIKARQHGLRVGVFDIEYRARVGQKKLHPLKDGLSIMARAAGIALLLNPTVTFVVPGLMIMTLGLVGALALSGGPVFLGALGLSINSFVLATLGILGGFQMVVFGLAATLYRVESGLTPRPWLLSLVKRSVRLGAAVLGVLVAAVGAVWLAVLVVGWVAGGAGDFLETGQLVLSASLVVFGLQLMSAGLFLSIFSGRLLARGG